MKMDDFINPVSIPDIINSLFFWKEVYSNRNERLNEALDNSIAALLPINDLLIEQSERIEINEGRKNDS
jgi:hypothetical protein